MDKREIKSAIEAILFASGEPIPMERIAVVIGVDLQEITEAADEIAAEYISGGRGLRLVHIKNSIQLCSAPEHALVITRAMEQRRPPKLSQTALEVLAIVAYFQPVTRAYVEQVRGVDSSYTVSLLAERGLIEPCGKLDVPGRPTIFQTTDLFLRTMGINNLDELPTLPDINGDDNVQKLQEAIDAINDVDQSQLEIEGI